MGPMSALFSARGARRSVFPIQETSKRIATRVQLFFRSHNYFCARGSAPTSGSLESTKEYEKLTCYFRSPFHAQRLPKQLSHSARRNWRHACARGGMPKIHSYSERDGKVVDELVPPSRQMRHKTAIRPRVESPSRQGEERRRCRPSPARRLRETSPAPTRRSDSDGPRSRESRGPHIAGAARLGRRSFSRPQSRAQSRTQSQLGGPSRPSSESRLRCPRERLAGFIRRLAGRSKPTAPLSAISIRSRVSSQLGTGFSVALTVQSLWSPLGGLGSADRDEL
jgi:hypothetical protein